MPSMNVPWVNYIPSQETPPTYFPRDLRKLVSPQGIGLLSPGLPCQIPEKKKKENQFPEKVKVILFLSLMYCI